MGKLSKYSIVLADTVVVTDDGPVTVTDKATKERKDVCYSLSGGDGDEDGEDEEEDEEARRAAKRERRAAEAAALAAGGAGRDGGRSTRLAARQTELEGDMEKRRKREEHQRELMAKQRQAAASRALNGGEGGGLAEEDEAERAGPIEAFKSCGEYPKGIRANAIAVDKAHDAVLVPLFGTLVPFHISTIKSVVKVEEGHKAFLRFNFFSANQVCAQGGPGI